MLGAAGASAFFPFTFLCICPGSHSSPKDTNARGISASAENSSRFVPAAPVAELGILNGLAALSGSSVLAWPPFGIYE